MEGALSRQTEAVMASMQPFLDNMIGLRRYAENPDAIDFLAGNPQEIASREYVATLQRWAEPKSKSWFAYGIDDTAARSAAAESLSGELGLDIDPSDIHLCRGAHGGLGLSLKVVVDPGDEVIFISPPWFFYEALILGAGATPVRVTVRSDTWDLDVDAIAAAITPRTKAILINTPNNPTGVVYPPETLTALGAVLTEASEKNRRPIHIISDEAYSRILFSGTAFHTPAAHYPRSLLIHTYSKSALAPGQRLGYLAVSRDNPDREQLRFAIMAAGAASGNWQPDAIMRYALPDIDAMMIDLGALERRRDRMVAALKEQGYELDSPASTFYLLVRSPDPDSRAFAERLAKEGVLVLAGEAFELPGYFRISLTATDEMVDRSLPVFARVIESARAVPTH